MNGVHDMGGVHGYGAIDTNDTAPYHHDWERQVLAITLAMGATGTWNLDQSRFSRESLPSDFYLSAGYYGIWLQALQNLLLKNDLITLEELNTGDCLHKAKTLTRVLKAENVAKLLRAGNPVTRNTSSTPAFKTGDVVTVRNLQPASHTRLPAYIRNRTGKVQHIHGHHVFPDTHASEAADEQPQWLYNVRFDAEHLWADTEQSECNRRSAVHVDCWESYLMAGSQ